MAVAKDASTPAITTIGTGVATVTTGGFTAPAGSLIRLHIQVHDNGTGGAAQTVTSVTNTGTAALTWTNLGIANTNTGLASGGAAAIWEAQNVSSNTITGITVNFSRVTSFAGATNGGTVWPVVFTGAKTNQAGAAVSSNTQNTVAAIAGSLTTTAAGSWVWGAVQNWNNNVVQTAGSGQTVQASVAGGAGDDATWVQSTTAPSGAAGAVTFSSSTSTFNGHYFLAEVLAAPSGTPVWVPSPPMRRRFALPRRNRTGRPTPVPAQQNPPLRSLAPSVQPRRLRGMTPRRGRQVSPVPAQQNPPLRSLAPLRRPVRPALRRWGGVASPPVPQASAPVNPPYASSIGRRRIGVLRRPGSFASPPVAPQAVIVPSFATANAQHRLVLGARRRSSSSTAPLAQAAPVPVVRRPVRFAGRRPARTTVVVPAQVNPPLGGFRPGSRRVFPTLLRRGRQVAPVPAQQTLPTNPPFATAGGQHRLVPGMVRRGRQVSPVPAQLNPPFPPGTVRPQARRLAATLRRGRPELPPVQVVPLAPQIAPQANRARRAFGAVARRSRATAPVPQSPVLANARGRRAPLVRRPRSGGAGPVPAQVIAPPIVGRPSSRRRLAGWALRRGRHVSWWPQAVDTGVRPTITGPLTTSRVDLARTTDRVDLERATSRTDAARSTDRIDLERSTTRPATGPRTTRSLP